MLVCGKRLASRVPNERWNAEEVSIRLRAKAQLKSQKSNLSWSLRRRVEDEELDCLRKALMRWVFTKGKIGGVRGGQEAGEEKWSGRRIRREDGYYAFAQALPRQKATTSPGSQDDARRCHKMDVRLTFLEPA